jgi:hypothetical protein
MMEEKGRLCPLLRRRDAPWRSSGDGYLSKRVAEQLAAGLALRKR